MVITLTGDNQYLIDQELTSLINKLGVDDGYSITKVSGAEVSLEDLKLELSSYSLFSDKRLVILNQPSKIKGFDEYVDQINSDIPASTNVVIIEPSLDKRKSYYKYLSTKTDFRAFNKLSGPALIKWVSDYIKEAGGHINGSDASYLVDRVGDNQLLLAQEITKLVLYSKDISRQNIDLLTEQSPASTIFELLDSAFNLDTKKALKIYSDQRLQKVEPEQILAMLAWQLNVLAIYMSSRNLSNSQILSLSGLSPYTLSKARQISSKLSLTNLKSLVKELSSLDFKSKTMSLDLDEGLKNFITGLSI